MAALGKSSSMKKNKTSDGGGMGITHPSFQHVQEPLIKLNIFPPKKWQLFAV